MGQPCCKIDEAKVTPPAIIRPDMTSPRSLPLLDKNLYDEQNTYILSPKDKQNQNLLMPRAIRTEEDPSTTKEDFITGSGSKHFDTTGRRIFQYKRGSLLDSNNDYIETWECLDLHTGERLAVKSYEILGDIDKTREDLDNLQDEINMWRELRHINLIKCYDIDLNQVPGESQKYNIDVVMEYASGGSIESLVCKFNNLDEKIAQYYTRQVLEGLAYLHQQGSVHGNLRGSNILIDSNGVVKLTDFELANKIKSIAQENLSEDNQIQDSILWAAPEVLAENRIEAAADVWSVGCVVIEMLTGNPPWMPIDKRDAFKRIMSGDAPPIPTDLSENCQDFLSEAFKYPPEDRPTIIELMDHPFLGQSKNTDASVLGESFLTLQTMRGNGALQSLATLPRHPSSDLHAIDNPSRVRISLSHVSLIRAKTLRRDSKIYEGGTEEHIEVPAKYKRNISLERYRLEGFQSRESIRKQITLPEVHETNYDEEEDNYSYNEKPIQNRQSRQSAAARYWPAAYVKKTVLEIHTEESIENRESALKSIDFSKNRKTDDKRGQVMCSEGDNIDDKFDIRTDLDNIDEDNSDNEYELEKANNFAPFKRSKFQNTSTKQATETVNENSVKNGGPKATDNQNQNAKGKPVNSAEERKRIEEEIMNQLLRLETKDLNQEIFVSSDKTLNKLESIHSQDQKPPSAVDDKEAQRKKFEEELMNQLHGVDSQELSMDSTSRVDGLNAEKDCSANRGVSTVHESKGGY